MTCLEMQLKVQVLTTTSERLLLAWKVIIETCICMILEKLSSFY